MMKTSESGGCLRLSYSRVVMRRLPPGSAAKVMSMYGMEVPECVRASSKVSGYMPVIYARAN